MKMNRLGRSDIEVSEICLGSMTWGTQNSEAEGHAQIDYALSQGINFIDTAELYPVNPSLVKPRVEPKPSLVPGCRKRENEARSSSPPRSPVMAPSGSRTASTSLRQRFITAWKPVCSDCKPIMSIYTSCTGQIAVPMHFDKTGASIRPNSRPRLRSITCTKCCPG